MMKKLLFLLTLSFAIIVSAQTTQTVNIDWGFSSNQMATGSLNTNRTIEVGDTVTWNWVGNGNHNVQSDQDAGTTVTQTFNSGSTVPAPNSYSFTFTMIGVTDYECAPHDFMNGRITVVAEGTLSTSNFEIDKTTFDISPNPAVKDLNVSISYDFNREYSLKVYDVLGKQIFKGQLFHDISSINISNWRSGVYLVKLSSDNFSQTKRFIKQ